jgi:aminoglycoside phosphotransferase
MPTEEFRTEKERVVVLSNLEIEKILSINPNFVSISKSVYFDNYDLPCPIQIEVERLDGNSEKVVLRKNRHGDVQLEVDVFHALNEFGLPVPKVLVEPFKNENGERCSVYSLLPGTNLQKLSSGSEDNLIQAKKLLIEAIQALSKASEFISHHKIFNEIPKISLKQELENIEEKDDEWLTDPFFQSAINFLKPKIDAIRTPLILSNGDYQPGNFLVLDEKLSGFLDFESASFQDPLMGFVKYPIYDLRPLSRTNLIDDFLKTMNFTREEFSIRLILGCMKILQKEIPLNGGDQEIHEYRTRVLAILKKELDSK